MGGLVFAILLAVLSFAKVSFVHGRPVFAYRQAVYWGAQETLLITEQGFPEGRTIFPQAVTRNGAVPTYADPGRFAGLAVFYARLANSDAVLSRITGNRNGPPPLVTAAPATSNIGNETPLPMLYISGEATTPLAAIRLAHEASTAFQAYLAEREIKAAVPQSQRVVVSVLNRAALATVARPRKKTIPLMVFVAVLGATIALALILENMRPRARLVERPAASDLAEARPQHPPIAGVGRADASR